MLGDTAVAVSPKDERYRDLVGQTLILPIVGREIPVVADEFVDPEFGTGALKITPGHDPMDWEIGRDHELPEPMVIGLDGLMTEEAGEFAGLTQAEAEKQIVGLKDQLQEAEANGEDANATGDFDLTGELTVAGV
jgi:valyl-tRNA synthetase